MHTKGTTVSGHIQGPWHYQEESDAYTHIVRGPNNEHIVQLPQDTSGKAEARARFIAGGPELLEALTEARAFVDRHTEDWYTTGNELLARIDAAIAKAEPR